MADIENPLASDLIRLGARMETIDGYPTAVDFGDAPAEAMRIRASAGFTDISMRGVLELTGKDRVRFVHGQTTANIKAMKSGEGIRAAQLLPNGKMNAAMTVLATDESLILSAERTACATLAERLKKFIIMDDVKVLDRSAIDATILVAGPRSSDVLQALTNESFETLPPGGHRVGRIGEAAVRIVGNPETGERGYEIRCRKTDLASVFTAIESTGIAPFGSHALDILRIESGHGVFGRDMTQDHLPNEGGLEDAISYTKGCYVGQEIIARLKTYGQVPKRLCGLVADRAIPQGAAIQDEKGLVVGQVSSSVFSPTLDRFIGLGILRREAAAATAPLAAIFDGRSMPVSVHALPFVARKYEYPMPA